MCSGSDHVVLGEVGRATDGFRKSIDVVCDIDKFLGDPAM